MSRTIKPAFATRQPKIKSDLRVNYCKYSKVDKKDSGMERRARLCGMTEPRKLNVELLERRRLKVEPFERRRLMTLKNSKIEESEYRKN